MNKDSVNLEFNENAIESGYDFYTVLQLVQNELSSTAAELFTDVKSNGDSASKDRYQQEVKTKKEKIRNSIGRIISQKRLAVKGMDSKTLCEKLYMELAEYSVLTKYIEDKDNIVEEINVNAWDDIQVLFSDGAIKKTEHFCNPQHAQNVVRRLATSMGAQIDDAIPMAEGNLRNNVRAVILNHPLVDESVGCSASIRLLKPQFSSREFFLNKETASSDEITFLETALRCGVSMIIVGATGSGKTTFMNYLLSTIPNNKRIVTIEHNARELDLIKRDEDGNTINNVVHTITKPSENPKYEVSQEDLVVKALRLDPNIICVGEMRDSEAYAAEEASMTGHTVITSLHADGVAATHFRVAMLALKKYPIDVNIALTQAAMAFPLIVYVSKLGDNSRKIMEIAECNVIEDHGETVRVYNTLYEYKVKSNKIVNGKIQIEGEHEFVSNISPEMKKVMMLNGATVQELDNITHYPKK